MTNGPIFFGAPTFFDPKQEVEYLRARLKESEGILERARKSPMPVATVVEVGENKCTLAMGPNLTEVYTPNFKIEPTNRVHIDPQTNAVLDVIKDPFSVGPVKTVSRVIDSRHVEIDAGPLGNVVVLYNGDPPKPGDRVVMDACQIIISRNLGQEPTAGPIYETGVTWDDIRAQEEAVRTLRDAIEGPVKDAKLLAAYGQEPVRGALVAGPPGCGKTLLGKAAATALAKMHGKKSTASGYQYVMGPEILNGLVGSSEAAIRKLFSNARTHFAEHHYPCVIFLDEGDALLGRRDNNRFNNMEKTIVPMFLTEMDGLKTSGAFVMVATNRPDMLDPAITRDKRLDLKVWVKRPNRDGAKSILALYFGRRPLDGMSVDEACEIAARELYHRRHVLFMVRSKSGREDVRFTLGDVVSGAMCDGLVARSVEVAIARDRETGKPSGIRESDIVAAADTMCAGQKMLDHTTDLTDIAQGLKGDFLAIEKAK